MPIDRFKDVVEKTEELLFEVDKSLVDNDPRLAAWEKEMEHSILRRFRDVDKESLTEMEKYKMHLQIERQASAGGATSSVALFRLTTTLHLIERDT